MKKSIKGLLSILTTGLILIFSNAIIEPAMAGPSGKVVVFNAGSLTVPLAEIEKRFEAKYPAIDVLREAGGSTQMARMISELDKPADIFASADFFVIDKELIPSDAEWNVRFASNQIVLCYTEKSRFANEINADNWHEILARKGVVWGHSDPNLDPCGYRSLMALQLAEKYYGKGKVQAFSENGSGFNVLAGAGNTEFHAHVVRLDFLEMDLADKEDVYINLSPSVIHAF